MAKNNLKALILRLKDVGNFDNPDFDDVDHIGKSYGFGKMESRQAFFAARDLATLGESERIDGGNGRETAKTNPLDVLEATFSRGEKNR